MIFNVLLLAAALSAGNAEFEEAAVRGAAEITVSRLRTAVVSEPAVTGVLVSAMLAEPSRYAVRAAASKSGEAVYLQAAGDRYREEIEVALRRLAGTRSPEQVFGTNFVRTASILTDEEKSRLLSGPYTNAFARERRQACDEQARTLVASVRPPMSAVDSDDEASVRKLLTANIAAQGGRTVFEENLDYVSQKIVDPLLADAKREKNRQANYVRQVRSDHLAPSILTSDIAWKLREDVRIRAAKTDNAALRWEVFPSVTNRTLAAAVERRVVGRLTDKVSEVKLDVSDEAVAQAIESGGEAQRTATEGKMALRTVFGATLLESAVAATVDEAKPAERDEVSEFLSSRLTSAAVTKAVGSRLTADLDPSIARVRAGLAEKNFTSLWPTLADRTWYPSADLADDVSARSDFASAVRNWRTLPALAVFNVRGKLEESDRMADRSVGESFELARAAVAGQTKIVDEVKPAVLSESRDRKNSFFTRTPDLKAIVEMLTQATVTRWSERKNAVLWPDADLPKNADEQHAGLFPSVKKRIELVAKEILEEMAQPEPKEKKPEEPPPPEDPPPEDTPPDEPPPEEPKMEFAILVSKEGERVTVKLEKGGSSVISRETDAKMEPFRSAMKEVADKLGQEILKLR